MSPSKNDLPDLLRAVERTAADLSDPAIAAEPIEYLYGGVDSVGVSVLESLVDVNVNPAPTTARPVVGPAMQYAKTAVKRATQWYVEPLAQKATDFNRTAAAVLHTIAERLERVETQARDEKARVRRLERQVRDLNERLALVESAIPLSAGAPAPEAKPVTDLYDDPDADDDDEVIKP